jgi:hypothetical protein
VEVHFCNLSHFKGGDKDGEFEVRPGKVTDEIIFKTNN